MVTASREAALRSGFYVEVTGVTGAGKTTWAEGAIDRLREFGHVFETNHPSRFDVTGLPGFARLSETRQNLALEALALPAVLRTPTTWPFVIMCVSEIIGSQVPVKYKTSCVRSVFRKAGSYVHWRGKGSNVIQDEGPIHAAHNVLVSPCGSPTERAIRRFAEKVPLPDLIVYIQADPEIALVRTNSRPDPPRLMDDRETRSFIMSACHLFENLLQHPRILPRVLRVTNSDESLLTISRIHTEMERCRRAREKQQ